jgi:TonB family protein
MQQRFATRARGFLSRGALISLLIHLNLVAPIAIAAWVYGGREEAQRAEEVDVAFQDASDTALPADLPPLEPTPEPPEAPAKLARERKVPRPVVAQPKKEEPKKQERLKEQQARELEKKQLASPEPEVVVPPLPPMPPSHQKIVDLDNDKDLPPPPDAHYLAQKNNRAEVETRATDTNLEKAQKGEGAASSPSERTDQQVGGDKEKIAQLEEQKSLFGKSAPDVTPHEHPELAEPKDQPDKAQKSLLALRDPAPRQHELTPETADLSLPRAADGDIPLPARAVRGQKSDPSRLASGNQVKLALSGKDYEYLFGKDAQAERRLAQTLRSTKKGKFQQKIARVQAALENFIPEVRPGNQTALNTRAAPFAAFITRMHRSIHQLWGFGQIEDWDEKSGSSPYNNPNLLTTLELVLNGDGTVDKVTVVQASGYLPYDVAAIDVAYSAGPYPDPPREIRSANGKIYIHWRFYRDARECGPAGVDYFILDNPPAGGDKPAVPEAAEPTTASPPAMSERAPGQGEAAGAQGSGAAAGPRRLEHLDGSSGRGPARARVALLGGEGAESHEVPPAPAEASPAPSPSSASTWAPPPRASDPAAHALAERWYAALASGDTTSLLQMAALPFRTGDKEVTSRADLAAMLGGLASEGVRRPQSIQLVTGAALRAAIGKLPPNLEDGDSAQLYAAVLAGPKDMLILVLGARAGVWKAVGLVRR